MLIASDDPAAGQKDWWTVDVEHGRLFFVGDPKQSIYRFRRADIAMFLKARDELIGASEQLTQNFRTGRPIVEWVNATFGSLIRAVHDSQPAYLPLLAGPRRTGRRSTGGVHRHGARREAQRQ